MATVGGPNLVEDGLIFAFDASSRKCNPNTGSVCFDLAGDSTGSLEGGATFTTSSFSFDGTDDVLNYNTPHNDSATALTYELVFKGSRVDPYTYILHNNGSSSTTGASYCTFGWDNNTNNIYGAFNGHFSTMRDTTTIIDSSKHYYLTLTWDGSTQKFYINGSEKTSMALTSISRVLASTTSLGGYRDGTYRLMNGEVSLVRIYNRKLTPLEILKNYNGYNKRFNF